MHSDTSLPSIGEMKKHFDSIGSSVLEIDFTKRIKSDIKGALQSDFLTISLDKYPDLSMQEFPVEVVFGGKTIFKGYSFDEFNNAINTVKNFIRKYHCKISKTTFL